MKFKSIFAHHNYTTKKEIKKETKRKSMTEKTYCDECGKEMESGIILAGKFGFLRGYQRYDFCSVKCFKKFVMRKFKLKQAGVGKSL